MTAKPLLQEEAVRRALQSMRTGQRLNNHPLRFFRSVQAHLESSAPMLAEDEAIQYAISRQIVHIIVERLTAIRRLYDIPAPDPNCGNFVPSVDFQHHNTELEAWSLLYHRYVCLDHDLSTQGIADFVPLDKRSLRRRHQLGVSRLTMSLAEYEHDFRRQDTRRQLLLALPTRYPPRFFGNESLVTTSYQILTGAEPPRHLLLHGPPGIGKTTLAQNLARDLVESELFDDLLWLKIVGHDPNHLLDDITARLGLSGMNAIAPVDRLKAYLFSHSVLIVLDGAEQVIGFPDRAAILAALDSATVILTSQLEPPADLWCYGYMIPELTQEQAFEYLDYVAGQLPRARPDWFDHFDTFWQVVGGNPRALFQLLAASYSFPVDEALLSHTDLGTIYRQLWDQLSPDERRIFLLPVLCFESGISHAHLLELADLPPARVNAAVRSLVNRALLLPHHETDTVRYTVQSVHVPFLIAHIRNALPISDQLTTRDFVRDVLARIVNQVDSAYHSLCILELLHDLDFSPDDSWYYAREFAPLIAQEGFWPAWVERLTPLLNGVQAPERIAWLHLALGIALRWSGRLDEALDHLNHTLEYYPEGTAEYADTLIELAVIHRYHAQWNTARQLARDALSIYQHTGRSDGGERCLHELAQLALEEHDPSRALGWLDRLEHWTARTWGIASQAHLQREHYTSALEAAERALHELPLKHPNCGRAAATLGQVYFGLGQTDAAVASLSSATLLLDEAKDMIGYARACNNLAVAYLNDESSDKKQHVHTREIHDLLTRAREIQEHVGDDVGLTVTRQNLAWFATQFPDLADD